MTTESSGRDRSCDEVDRRTEQALAALLAIDADTAAEVRERTPARRRPARQYGPQLDLGDESDRPDN